MTKEGLLGSNDDEMQYDEYQLNALQDKALLILPIPSAMLSILGSSTIIFMIIRIQQQQKLSPYTRLLLGLSIYDIIFSMTVSVGGFMRPQDSSRRVFAFGNDTTCSASGFFTQVSYGALLYNAMLSYYFLLTTRFGWSNKDLSRWLEPLMHAFGIGYPFVTAIVGAIIDAYSETMFGLGCWINEWPKGSCSNEEGHNGQKCYTSLLGWTFSGWLILFVFISLLANNLAIWWFVRRQTRAFGKTKHGKRPTRSTLSDVITEDVLISTSLSGGNEYSPQNPSSSAESTNQVLLIGGKRREEEATTTETKQLKRLRLIRSQAFLFVASFFTCSIWMFLLGIGESRAHNLQEELKMMLDRYPLLLLSSIFTPLQGFLNLIVYTRPKWIRIRSEYPSQPRYWAAKRIVLGTSIAPSKEEGSRHVSTPSHENENHDGRITPNNPQLQNIHDEIDDELDKSLTPVNGTQKHVDSSSGQKIESRDKNQCIKVSKEKLLHRTRISSISSISQSSIDHKAGHDSRWEGSSNRQSHSWIPLKAAQRFKSELPSETNGSIQAISEISDTLSTSFAHNQSVWDGCIEEGCEDYGGDVPEWKWLQNNNAESPFLGTETASHSAELSKPQRRLSETGSE